MEGTEIKISTIAGIIVQIDSIVWSSLVNKLKECEIQGSINK